MSENQSAQTTTTQPPEPGGSAASPSDTQKSTLLLLKAYAKTYKKLDIDFDSFVSFVSKYVDQYGGRYRQLMIFEKNPRETLAANLKSLDAKKHCHLVYRDSDIARVEFPQYLSSILKKAYRDMEATPDIPFPEEESLGVSIPRQMMTVIDVHSGLPGYLKGDLKAQTEVLRIVFPGNLGSLIVGADQLPRGLLADAIRKVRVYLSQGNNASYVQSRLRPGFSSNPNLLREMVNAIIMKPDSAAVSFVEASDLTFRLWANLSNLIIKEYKEKKDMLATEKDVCKAAHLISVFNIHYREEVKQKSDEKKNTIAGLDEQLKKPPYLYTLNEIHDFKGPGGKPLLGPDSREGVIKFLEAKTRPKSNQIIPDLIRIKTSDGKEHFLYKDNLPSVFVRRINETGEELEEHYITKWVDALWHDEEPEAMRDDAAFLQDLANIVRSYYPLLRYMLNYNLLTGIEREITVSPELGPEFDRCLDRRSYKLKPLNEILRLDRRKLVKDAKNQMPIWGQYRLSRKVGLMLARFFRGLGRSAHETGGPRQRPGGRSARSGERRKAAERGQPESSKIVVGSSGRARGQKSKPGAVDSRVAYKKALLALKEELLGKNASIPAALDELVEKWNPIYEPKARANLVEDVNAMIRDYVRGLRKGFRLKPPDLERIRAFAVKLSQNPAFDRIKQKEHFKRYIEVYMLKVLGEK